MAWRESEGLRGRLERREAEGLALRRVADDSLRALADLDALFAEVGREVGRIDATLAALGGQAPKPVIAQPLPGRCGDVPAFRRMAAEPESALLGAGTRQLAAAVERLTASHAGFIAQVGLLADQRSRRLGAAFAAAGLAADGWAGAVAGVQDRLLRRDALERRIEHLPFGKPLAGLDLRSGFGARDGGHEGLDLGAPAGTPVLAAGRGVVAVAGPRGPYGLMVELRHAEGLVSRYAHLDCLSVAEGAVVPLGAPLGEVGASGRATGPHLHFEIRQGDRPLDPLRFLLAGSF